MENISEHISYEEGMKSSTAIRLGIDNTPTEEILENMKLTAEKIFEPLRNQISQLRGKDTSIQITSFYRCEKLNSIIGGSKTSQHCKGQAMDIETNYPDFDKKKLFLFIKEKCAFDQLIWEFGDDNEPAWIHVSYSNNNRGQILKSISNNGTKYIPLT